MRSSVNQLTVIDFHQLIAKRQASVGNEGLGVRGVPEQDETPSLRTVHVDDPLRRPYPVILRPTRLLLVPAIDNVKFPFHARKPESPVITILGWGRCFRDRLERGPWNCNLHRPSFIGVRRVIEGPLKVHCCLEPGDLKAIVRLAPILVGAIQEQIPSGVEGVQFQFGVSVIISIRIDKDLEVIILKNNRIVFADAALQVRFEKLCSDVQVFVIPKKFRSRGMLRCWERRALDIDELVGPNRMRPFRRIQFAIDLNGCFGPQRDDAARHYRTHAPPIPSRSVPIGHFVR